MAFPIVIAFEYHNASSPRTQANVRKNEERWGAYMEGRRHHACPACDGHGDDGHMLDMCLPCSGTGVAASARYWDL